MPRPKAKAKKVSLLNKTGGRHKTLNLKARPRKGFGWKSGGYKK